MDLKDVLSVAPKAYFHMEPFSIRLDTSTEPLHGYLSGGWVHDQSDAGGVFMLDIAVADRVSHTDAAILRAVKTSVSNCNKSKFKITTWKRFPGGLLPNPEKVLKYLTISSIVTDMPHKRLIEQTQLVLVARVAGYITMCCLDFWEKDEAVCGNNTCTWIVYVPCAMLENKKGLQAMQAELAGFEGMTGDEGRVTHFFTMELIHNCNSTDERNEVEKCMTDDALRFQATEWDRVDTEPKPLWRTYSTTYNWSPLMMAR